MANEFINPPSIHPPGHWTHVVRASGGTTVYVAGQLGVTPDGTLLAGLDAQAPQAYVNLRAALAAAGATARDVVKETVYIVGWDFNPEKLKSLRAAREETYGGRYPASTLVGVQSLGRKEYFIEVEAVAVVGP